MIKLTDEQIKSIAEDLDCGLVCYYNKKTGEIKSIIDFDKHPGADSEGWDDDIKEIEDNNDDYIEFEGMESFESFRVMEDFANMLQDSELQSELFNALNRKHPFRNFKSIIDNSGHIRQEWFDFKSQKYMEWVTNQIEQYNFSKKEADE